MLRRIAATTLGLALLVSPHTLAPPASAGPDERAVASTAKSRDVSLGHRSIGASSRTTVRLTFDGRRGQLVNLARWGEAETCGGRVLKTERGKVVEPWAKGYWRLPRTGSYTAVAKSCRRLPKQKVRVQARRVVQHETAVPGVATTIGGRARVTHLVPVPVGASQTLEATTNALVTEVIGPDMKVTLAPVTGPLTLEEPGEHWLALEPDSTLVTVLRVRYSAQVDGQRNAIPAMGTVDTTHEVAFTGQAGQWVYAELLDAAGNTATDTTRDIRVIAADGREVQTALLHDCSQTNANDGCTPRGPWHLPATGDYTMTISADRPRAEQPTTLRIRAAAVAPDLTINGPSVTYASTTPGQWVVGRYPHTPFVLEPAPGGGETSRGTLTYLEATNVSASLGAWSVTAATSFPFYSLYCGWDKACEYTYDQLNPVKLTMMTPPSYWVGSRPFALLVVPPNAQGSMDLTLTKPPRES